MLLSIFKNNLNQVQQKPKNSQNQCVSSTFKLPEQKRDEVTFGKKIELGHSFPFAKFEGIQKDIPVFEGVSLPEIFFLGRNLNSIPVERLCRSHCSHCFLKADVPTKPAEDEIHYLLWEDFLSLTSGIKELKQRLGTNFLDYDKKVNYVTLFLDSDTIGTKIRDQKGESHDIAEAAKIAYNSIGRPILVDTTGWNKDHIWPAGAAKKLARFFVDNPDALCDSHVNISVNPFHSIMEKSLALTEQKPEKAYQLHEIYTDRMANAFRTFLACGVVPSERIAPGDSHGRELQIELNRQILAKLNKSLEGVNLSPRVTSNHYVVSDYLKRETFEQILPIGRGKQFFEKGVGRRHKENHLHALQNKVDYYQGNFFNAFFDTQKTVDINGRVWAGNSYFKQDTGIQLNFINRDKKTPVIHSYLEKMPRLYNPE